MINKVTLIGNMGMDPEIRHLESGVMVGRFSLATNESYKDKEGNWQKLTEWHNVVVWREQAETVEKYYKKGNMVYVEGKISYRKYQDKDGVERYATDIVASTIRSLEKRESSAVGFSENRFPTEEKATAARQVSVSPPQNDQTAATQNNQPTTDMPTEGDNLPF